MVTTESMLETTQSTLDGVNTLGISYCMALTAGPEPDIAVAISRYFSSDTSTWSPTDFSSVSPLSLRSGGVSLEVVHTVMPSEIMAGVLGIVRITLSVRNFSFSSIRAFEYGNIVWFEYGNIKIVITYNAFEVLFFFFPAHQGVSFGVGVHQQKNLLGLLR